MPRPLRPRNVCLALFARQESGRWTPPSRLSQLPEPLAQRINKDFGSVPSLVQELGVACETEGFWRVREVVKQAADALTDSQSAMPMHGGSAAPGASANMEWFVLFGGAQQLVRLIQVPINGTEARTGGYLGYLASKNEVWELRRECLQLLRDLCYSLPSLSELLSSQRPFVIFLFSLMRHKVAFDEAVGLAEEILALRGEVFPLSAIPDVGGLIRTFSKRQMAFFCRVLALLVFESEERTAQDLKISQAADLLAARREQALSPQVKTTDKNHAVLLGISEFLPRMVKLVVVHRMPLSRWADEIISNLPPAQLALLGVDDGDDWHETPAPPHNMADPHESLKALALLTHQVEVLFVLCTLLAGKRKSEVQERLLNLGIVPALIQMFERMDWKRPPTSPPPSSAYTARGASATPRVPCAYSTFALSTTCATWSLTTRASSTSCSRRRSSRACRGSRRTRP